MSADEILPGLVLVSVFVGIAKVTFKATIVVVEAVAGCADKLSGGPEKRLRESMEAEIRHKEERAREAARAAIESEAARRKEEANDEFVEEMHRLLHGP